jgi:hypothetical protein
MTLCLGGALKLPLLLSAASWFRILWMLLRDIYLHTVLFGWRRRRNKCWVRKVEGFIVDSEVVLPAIYFFFSQQYYTFRMGWFRLLLVFCCLMLVWVAFLFVREHSGSSNDDIYHCRRKNKSKTNTTHTHTILVYFSSHTLLFSSHL